MDIMQPGQKNRLKAAIYVRVSTADQHVESQLYDLRELASRRSFEVVKVYQDCGVSGRRARRPGLDALMADARQHKFAVVLVAAFDRVARSTRHFLQVIDELDSLGVAFISRREGINTDDHNPMAVFFLTLIGSIAELESDLIRERVLAGMRRARLDGVRIGRTPMSLDRAAIVRDRLSGMIFPLGLRRVSALSWSMASLTCRLSSPGEPNVAYFLSICFNSNRTDCDCRSTFFTRMRMCLSSSCARIHSAITGSVA